jgi:hypothetical protein
LKLCIARCALTLDGLKSSYGVTFLWTEMLKCYERATRYPGLHKEKERILGLRWQKENEHIRVLKTGCWRARVLGWGVHL